MLHTIRRVVPERDFKLRLTYADGETIVVDFKPLVEQGGLFEPLGDPAFFTQVSLGERGRYIEWPGGLDFCADALWLEGHANENAAEVQTVISSP